MKDLRLFLFGSPHLEHDGQLVEMDTRKALALLAFLALSGQEHQRDALAALLYPEADSTNARAAFRRTLSTLHGALGEGVLSIRREAVGLPHEDSSEASIEEHPGQYLRWLGSLQRVYSELLRERNRLDEARAVRDARLEATLRSMKGTDGRHATVVTNKTGQVRAAATAAPATAEAAFVAFLAGRLEAIGGLLNSGVCREVSVSGPSECIWIARRDGAYLACWLDGRASLHPVKRLLQPLLSRERADAPQRTADESSLNR